MANISSQVIRSKFRGCLLGVLTGDCLGGPFEREPFTGSAKMVTQRYFDFINSNKKALFKSYTDDYALTKSIATSLIEKQKADYNDIAKSMTKEFFMKPQRGYGRNVTDIFIKMRENNFEDIYELAKAAFDGRGSVGNGGAMRVAPLALFYHNNHDAMVDAVVNSTKITHAHKEGINGAILQALAICKCLSIQPSDQIDANSFIGDLMTNMKAFEGVDSGAGADQPLYKRRLELLMEIYSKKYENQEEQDYDVVKYLGNTVHALHSVPTAIFCLLRAQKDIDEVKNDNLFLRTIQYAISLGGDTDTIASMAGALAGAHQGDSVLTDNTKKHLENAEEAQALADQLFEVASSNNFK